MLDVQSAAETHVRRVQVSKSDAATSVLEPLLSIAKSVRALYGLKLSELGFHNGQDELLLAVGEGGLPVSAMAEKLVVRPSTVSKMMDRLVERGLVERIADVRDGRRTLIRMTPIGMEARDALLALRREVDATLAKALDADAPLSDDADATLSDRLDECAVRLVRQLRRLR